MTTRLYGSCLYRFSHRWQVAQQDATKECDKIAPRRCHIGFLAVPHMDGKALGAFSYLFAPPLSFLSVRPASKGSSRRVWTLMEDAQLAQILSGLEQRLARQLTLDRQAIVCSSRRLSPAAPPALVPKANTTSQTPKTC